METPATSSTAMSVGQPLTFDQWYQDTRGEEVPWNLRDGSVGGFLNNLITGDVTKINEEYNKYLTDFDRQFEVDKINNARAWEEAYDSSKYQRTSKDIEAAGLNPGMVLQSGVSGGSGVYSPSGQSSVSSARKSSSRDTAEQFAGFVGRLVGTALMVTGMIAAKGSLTAAAQTLYK